MPALKNAKYEHFAQLIAGGKSPTESYALAGYSEKGAHASAARLLRNATVCTRVAELQAAASERAIEKAALDKVWVLDRLKENVERAMQAVPARDSEGKPTGEYRYEGTVANRGLELIGKELGMFREKLDMTMNAQISAVSVSLAEALTPAELRDLERKLLAKQAQAQLAAPVTLAATAEAVNSTERENASER